MSTDTDKPVSSTPGVQTSPDTKPSDTPDYGTMNRELLAERLRKAYYTHDRTTSQTWYYESYIAPSPAGDEWLNVANEAIGALLGDASE